METMRKAAILFCILAPAGWAFAQSGQVRFCGTVAKDEDHDVIPVCYGDYHVSVNIGTVLEDPEQVLTDLDSVQVCYETARSLVSGDDVEVYGYFWGGGSCPKQYCGRVQIVEKSDYIRRVAVYGDDDWMVSGDLMYSIPSGNVGIGTSQPAEKLHVVGNVLVEGALSAWLRLLGSLGNDAGISLTTTGAGVNTWEIVRQGSSADLLIRESFPYPPFGGERMVVKAGSGNVGVGTNSPDGKLHVLGDVIIESPAGLPTLPAIAIAAADAAKPLLQVVKKGTGRQLAAHFINPDDDAAEVEIQLAGGRLLPWGWSIKAASGMLTLGSVMVLPPALNIKSTGYLGIGDTSPEYRLELPNTAGAAGRARANDWVTYSSQRWKTNIRTIDGAMDKVRHLRGVYFDWKDQGVHDMGMVAEEVGRVIPEVVDYEANGTDAESLAYGRLVALLVEAMKEQDARIAELEQLAARHKELEHRLDTLERLIRQQARPLRQRRPSLNRPVRSLPVRACPEPAEGA